MNRMLLAAVAILVASAASVAFGQDIGFGYPQNGDPWNAVPQPSGLRFAAYGDSTVLTSDTGGGGGGGVPYAPCCGGSAYPYCWACGGPKCVHWTQYSWYASWGHGCGCTYGKCGKHEWLH
jgi:hypothetical protein